MKQKSNQKFGRAKRRPSYHAYNNGKRWLVNKNKATKRDAKRKEQKAAHPSNRGAARALRRKGMQRKGEQ